MNKKVEQVCRMAIKYIEDIKLNSAEIDQVITVLDEFFLLVEQKENSNVIHLDEKRPFIYLESREE